MKGTKTILSTALALLFSLSAGAQMYNGMSGLIHTPSADMDPEGTMRIGMHYIDRSFVPANLNYDTYTYYINATPYPWIEGSYTCMAFKVENTGRYSSKDRHFSLKLRVLEERRWLPGLALGTDDPLGSNFDPNRIQGYFSDFWAAAKKHVDISGHIITANLGYRYYRKEYNKQFEGVFGSITYSPAFAPTARAILEYDGCHINCGMDAVILKHLLFQASLTDGKQPSFGLALYMNIL